MQKQSKSQKGVVKHKTGSKIEAVERRLNVDFLESRLSQPQVWEVDFYKVVLALFLTFLVRSSGYVPETLSSSQESEIYKREKDGEFTSILLKLENTALDSFAASIGL